MNKGIVASLAAVAGGALGATVTSNKLNKRITEEHNLSEKHLSLMLALNQWLIVKQEGKSLTSYFEKNGYKKIAIYGMSYLGERLVDELKNSDIEVAYGIDRNANNIYTETEVRTMEEDLDSVDVIIVTAITFFDEIEEKLESKVDCPIVSLEDILYGV